MAWIKLTGHKNPENFTAGVVFERDEETDEPSVYANVGEPVDLSAANVKWLEDYGFEYDKSSKEEHDQFVASGGVVDAGIAASGPILGETASNPAPGESESKNK